MKSFTIGRKIALGFGSLLLLTATLGAIAVFSMRVVQQASRKLATEYIPEVDLSVRLQHDLAVAQLAIRSYGFTLEPAYLEKARTSLQAVHGDLKKGHDLSKRFPELIKLKEALSHIDGDLALFATAVDNTEAANREIIASRKKLDAAAAGFLSHVEPLIAGQRAKLQDEIKQGADAALLQERLRKLTLAQEILDLGDNVRISAFKAQALRDTAHFQEALKTFQHMEVAMGTLRGLLKAAGDIAELDRVKAEAFAYRDAMKTVLANSEKLVVIGQTRAEVADRIGGFAAELAATGMMRTVDAADSSDARLSQSSVTMLAGVGAALALGLVTAFYIIRQTTKVLTSVADDLTESATQVTAAASQVAAASRTLAEGATEQASSLEETSASLEEISSMTRRNAEAAQEAKDISSRTRASADTGAAHMREMRGAMDAIKASSDGIAKIIKTIDEIAFQTNILALNAAVEAARAGDAGLGFAVVADEVRNLAQRSAQSAKETATKIEDAIGKSEQGVTISAKVAASLTDIVEKARKMDELVGEIATGSSEQNQGIGQLNGAVSQMDKVTQSNASGAEESAAAAEELNAQAASMQQAVEELRRLIVDRPGSPSEPHRSPEPRKVSRADAVPSHPSESAPKKPRRSSARIAVPAASTPAVHREEPFFN